MSSKKVTKFFEHPNVVLRKGIKSQSTTVSELQKQNSLINTGQIQQRLKQLKRKQINEKKEYLQNLKNVNNELENEYNNLKQNILSIVQKQKRHLKQLEHKLVELDTQISNCNQVEKVEAMEFLQWQSRQVNKKHKQRMQQLQKSHELQKQRKKKQINMLKIELQEELQKIRMLQQQQKQQLNKQIPVFNQPQIVMPNLRLKNTQLNHLKQKIQSLKQNKKLLITQIKQQLNSNTWKVKDTFQNSKQKINRQMRKLINYLDKPDKQVIKGISNPQKIPNPISLIQNYQNRLQQLQQSLPSQLKTDQIIKCLKPLPWRSLKGALFQQSSATIKVHQKFNKLQKDYLQVEARNNEYRQELKQLQNGIIQKYNKKISEFDAHIKDMTQN